MSGYISRGVPLTDLEVKGRTITAYAAVFDTPAEIHDGHGHYNEIIARSAFNRTIKNNGTRAAVFYNHGMTIHGTPSDAGSIPIGSPQSITADKKGLLTVSRFNATPLADAVLEAINDGGVTGYSFTGRMVHSDPERLPRARQRELPTITRTELGLKEYGPTPFPYYESAEILSVRSATQLPRAIMSKEDEATLLYELLMRATRTFDPAAIATPEGPGTHEDDAPEGHLSRNRDVIRDRIARSGVLTWQSGEAKRSQAD